MAENVPLQSRAMLVSLVDVAIGGATASGAPAGVPCWDVEFQAASGPKASLRALTEYVTRVPLAREESTTDVVQVAVEHQTDVATPPTSTT